MPPPMFTYVAMMRILLGHGWIALAPLAPLEEEEHVPKVDEWGSRNLPLGPIMQDPDFMSANAWVTVMLDDGICPGEKGAVVAMMST